MDQAAQLRARVNAAKPIRKDYTARVIAVSSGKGGVGKSNVALNMGIRLAMAGHRTIVLDADIGMANIEVLLGVSPDYSLADVLSGICSITDAITKTQGGLDFISGGSGIMDVLKTGGTKLSYITQIFGTLDQMYDIILIDTGAGAGPDVINFIQASKEVIIVITPEPTALMDSYSLLKILKKTARDEENLPAFSVVVNRAETVKEGMETYNKIHNVCHKFLKLRMNLLAILPYDFQVIKAVKAQKATVLHFPKSPFAKSIAKAAESLCSGIANPEEPAGISGFVKKLSGLFGS